MDLCFDQSLTADALTTFLDEQFARYRFFLLYPNLTDWNNVPGGRHVCQYISDESRPGPFRYGIALFMPGDDLLPFLEHLAAALAARFGCRVLCDASRVVSGAASAGTALLFAAGTVFLVDDHDLEDTGTITHLGPVAYEPPPAESPDG